MAKYGKFLIWALALLLAPQIAQAAEGAGGAPNWGAALGAGIAFGLAGLGCGIAQGMTAGNTTAGIARNPGAAGAMNVPFILGMALIESIALVGFVTAFLLIGEI